MFNDRPVHGKDFLVSVSGDRQVLTIPEVGDAHIGIVSCIAENAAGRAICSAKVEIGELTHLYYHACVSIPFADNAFNNVSTRLLLVSISSLIPSTVG